MSRGHKSTREESVTKKIVEMLADLRLDLDMVGLYFSRYARLTIYKRLEYIYETAKYHREQDTDRENHYDYIRNI